MFDLRGQAELRDQCVATGSGDGIRHSAGDAEGA
jgi:hypothetical protein